MARNLCWVWVSAMALGGCMAESEDIEVLERDAQIEEIVDNLEQAGYPADEIDVDDQGVVIVGGDAVVSLQASREMIGLASDGDAFRQYRTYNLVDTGSIQTICVSGGGLSGTLSTALDNAIDNYNDLNLSLTFVRNDGAGGGGGGKGKGGGGGGGGGGTSCDATISVSAKGPVGGQAGFPSGGEPYDKVQIGKGTANYGVAVSTHVLTHELGHCIGLRHSDYFDRSISCGGSPSNEGEGGVGAVHISGTPTGAVEDGSVLNSCFHTGSTGVFTNSDVNAFHALY